MCALGGTELIAYWPVGKKSTNMSALMTGPQIVLMDEFSMVLSPILVMRIFAIIEELHKILLVEQWPDRQRRTRRRLQAVGGSGRSLL